MEIQEEKTQQEAGTEGEIGYRVFYSDSEEMAKLLAVSHIQANMNADLPPVVRPKIPFLAYLLGLILPVALYAGITALLLVFGADVGVWPFVAGYLAVFLCTVKPGVILFVLLYQKLAPERMRRSCRFEPTCSNYMLQAIAKYGFWRGFIKGVGRLCRCHHPNGGIDLP